MGRPTRWSWVTLRSNKKGKLFRPYTDSFKRFKAGFFKVVAEKAKQPFFLLAPAGPHAAPRFPLYWTSEHYRHGSAFYRASDLTAEEQAGVDRIQEYARVNGPVSAASLIEGTFVDTAPLQTHNMGRPELSMKKKKSGAVAGQKRKAAPSGDGSGAVRQKVNPPQVSPLPVANPVPLSVVRPDAEIPEAVPQQPPPPTSSPVMVGSSPSSSQNNSSGAAGSSPLQTSIPSQPSVKSSAQQQTLTKGCLWREGCIPELAEVLKAPARMFAGVEPTDDEMAKYTQLYTYAMQSASLAAGVPLLRMRLADVNSKRSRAEKERDELSQALAAEKSARLKAEAALSSAEVETESARAARADLEEKNKALEAAVAKKDAARIEAILALKRIQTEYEEDVGSLKFEVGHLKEEVLSMSGKLTEAEEKAAEYEGIAERTAKQYFDNAVEQIRATHPDVVLDLSKIDVEAWVEDGQMMWPESPMEEDVVPEEADEGAAHDAAQGGSTSKAAAEDGSSERPLSPGS